MPDMSGLPDPEYDWNFSIYEGATEIPDPEAPPPLGKPVQCISYVDANLFHDLTTGRSVTGVLHLVNGTPFDWFSKKQSTVETATYGSEFVAARTAAEQIIANRAAFRYLGVPISGPCFLFGDNRSVVVSGTIPQSKLNKRHVYLSFHRVRETIAARIMRFHWIDTHQNPADVLSKHWALHKVSNHLHHLLFMRSGSGEVKDDKG
jgi:hypothetical protein